LMKTLVHSGWIRLTEHLSRLAAAYGVLIISVLLTVLAFLYVRQNVESQTRTRFEDITQATQQAIERRTKAYVDAMFGARGFFHASESVTRKEWANYVEGIEPSTRFEGLQALSYAQRVMPREREAFELRASKEGLPDLKPDLDPGGERSAYFPITHTGPLGAPLGEANSKVLGYDFYAEDVHRSAMDKARDSGSPRATEMVYILSEAPASHPADLALRTGYVVYLPIYEKGAPLGTVKERRSALQGFIVGSFKSDELLEGVFSGSIDPLIDFEVYDGKDVFSSPLLYDSDGIERAGEGGPDTLFSKEDRTEVAGREWSLFFATLPQFEEGAESKLPTFVLASGFGVSALLFGITLLLVRSRTLAEHASRDLEEANRELEAFSYSVSHDLRAPLRSIEGFSQILLEDYADKLDEEGEKYLGRVRAASRRMALLIDDLLDLSRVSRRPLRRELVDLSAQAREITAELGKSQPDREVEFVIADRLAANGDARLLRLALENLLGNAWKFTSREERARIEFRSTTLEGRERVYFVRDNGVGFDEAYAGKLFGAFQRLHEPEEFEGTGIGLATVQRIVRRHGGRVWAEGEVGKGATFFFTLGGAHRQESSLPSKKAEIV
jgi:signal transduction histidine kinase